jgi:hypothetical protein
MDACLINMLNNLMGFEFKSKITPFAAQKFVQNSIVFLFIFFLWPNVQTKESFRIFFTIYLIFNLISCAMMMKFKFRQKVEPVINKE